MVFEDNTSARRTLKGRTNKKIMRRLLIKAAYVRQAVVKGEIDIYNIEGKHQLADALTKALSAPKFFEIRNYLLSP